jgi:hypothetical protein
VLQVGHVAVNRAFRYFEAFGEKSGGTQAAAADQLDEVEETVGTAHGDWSAV